VAPSPLQKAGLAAEIIATYPRVRWLLWRRDLPAAVAALRRSPEPREPDADPSVNRIHRQGRRLGRAASRILTLLPADSRCLVRSLVLLALLARRRIEARLVIGARQGPDFGAHAWVELGGVPLIDPGPPEYERLVEL
jgi:transglutaminase superfamily protein